MSIWLEPRGDRPLIVGHRGVRGEGMPDENTLRAFDTARTQGARAIELDVRLSRDGEVVVFHDPDLSRMTSESDHRAVERLDWRELRAVELARGDRIPLLADVLEWARAHDVAVNVEVKRDLPRSWWPRLVQRVARLVRDPRVDVLVSSFDPVLVSGVGAIAPQVPRAWLTDPKESPSFDAMALCARLPLVHAMHPRRDQLTPLRVDRLHAVGARVGVYTVNDVDEARRFTAWGVDWLITDVPGALLAALA